MFKCFDKIVPISILSFIFFIFCSVYCVTVNAAIFTIEPAAGTVLPTVLNTIPTKAYYTITNSTSSTRSGIFVKYLPPNVTQVTSSALPNVCAQNFSLAPHQSCTLELNITGPVSSNDPNPQHHLFVCVPGCYSCCTGTFYPLNVTSNNSVLLSLAITASSNVLQIGQTLPFNVIASYSDGTTRDVTAQSTYTSSDPTVATVNISGAAQGVSPGTFTVTAFFEGLSAITPTLTVLPAQVQAVSLTINPQIATIPVGTSISFIVTATYSDATTRDVTAQSTYSSSNSTVASIDSSGKATGISPGTFIVTADFEGLTTSTQALTVTGIPVVSLSISPQTIVIPVGATIPFTVIATYADATTQDVTLQSFYTSTDPSIGTVDSNIATATGISPGIFIVSATFNGISTSTQDLTVRTQVSYVTNINGNSVSQCSLDSSGVLSNCVLATGYLQPEAIVLSTRALVAFVSQNSLATPIVACRVDLNNGMLMNCINTGFSQADDPQGLAINKNGTKLYVSTYSQSVYSCDINQITGQLSGCVSPPSLGGLISWTGVILDESETYAYLSNYDQPVMRCAINPIDNTLEDCINSNVTDITTTDGIGLNNQYLYIATFNKVTKCLLDPTTGLASQCTDSGVGEIFFNAQNVTFTADKQFAYIPNRNNNTLTRCTVDSLTGDFSSCITALAGLSGPTSAFIR